ncbi:MAG: hypothetical protein ABIU09_02200 [Pyrinomonadaceae bacterium]
MSDQTTGSGFPKAFETIVYGGLAIGILDAIDAMGFFWFYAGASPVRIWQSVAAGLIGRDAAVAGGLASSALGLFLHFVIALLIAAVYYIGARNISFLLRHPVMSGLIFGVIANFVMQYVVIPLSAAPGSAVFRLGPFLNGVIGHAFLVGLPVALIAVWSARRQATNRML